MNRLYEYASFTTFCKVEHTWSAHTQLVIEYYWNEYIYRHGRIIFPRFYTMKLPLWLCANSKRTFCGCTNVLYYSKLNYNFSMKGNNGYPTPNGNTAYCTEFLRDDAGGKSTDEMYSVSTNYLYKCIYIRKQIVMYYLFWYACVS